MSTENLDLLIVGSGPAGLSAAAHARQAGLSCAVLERSDHLADTVHCYQKRKYVMAEPAQVPLRSPLPFAAGSREEVLDAWGRFVAAQQIRVDYRREVESVERRGDVFHVRTSGGVYHAARVVLAVGTQGNPRRLGVPGEDLPQVSNRLIDPDAHRDEDVVVVGAGDSALEVAIALSERNRVSLIVRSEEIVRAKESLEREVLSRQATGQLTIHFRTTVKRIVPGFVDLQGPEEDLRVAADRVILKIGAEPPRALLERCGVTFASAARDARPRLDRHHQTETPGLYLIGAAAGRDLIKLGINQGYEVVEHVLGREVEPADEAVLKERLPYWSGSVRQRLESLRQTVPLLRQADPEDLREVFLLAQVRDADDGEVIVRQNDYTDSFLVITAGRVAIDMRDDEGVERRVAELGTGDFFGEMGLISGRRRNATATALGPCRLLEIPRKAMIKLLHVSPRVKATLDRVFLLRALQSYVFPELDDASLWPLVEAARQLHLGRDQVVFEEGEIGDAFYLVRHGMVKLSKRSGDRQLVLTYLGAGNVFGETALLERAARTATVTTIFPTDLIVLDKAVFDDFLTQRPALRQQLLEAYKRKTLEGLEIELRPGGGVLDHLIELEAVIGTDVLVIDNHKCVRCGNCVAACEGVHADGQARLSLTGSKLANLLFPNSCMQCENPLCMLDCPPDAIVRRAGGEIQIKDTCIGCGNCAANCPYDNIFMVQPKAGRGFFGRLLAGLGLDRDGGQAAAVKKEVAVKCDLCAGVDGGAACVRSCPTGAAIRLESKGLRRGIEALVAREELG